MSEQKTTAAANKRPTKRSSLSIPGTAGDILYRRYEATNPKRDDGRKMPFGEWLGVLALDRLREIDTGSSPVALLGGDPNVEKAAARGAAVGVARSLEGFARELGEVLSERLIDIEQRLALIEVLLDDGAEV